MPLPGGTGDGTFRCRSSESMGSAVVLAVEGRSTPLLDSALVLLALLAANAPPVRGDVAVPGVRGVRDCCELDALSDTSDGRTVLTVSGVPAPDADDDLRGPPTGIAPGPLALTLLPYARP